MVWISFPVGQVTNGRAIEHTFFSMRTVGQLAPRIHINQSRFLSLFIKPRHFFSLQYISRSQYVRYSCEQGWEGDRGRGNKGLMSLAKRGWRLRQMAWSLQHSGVARLVLKSSSLTFQQILPGGWGVCHTTPRIHTALFTPLLSPPPILSPGPNRASDHSVSYFILTYVYIHTLTCIEVDHYRPGTIRITRGCRYDQTPSDCSYGKEPGGLNWERWPLLTLQYKKSYSVNTRPNHGGTVQSIYIRGRRHKKLFD